MSYINNWDNQVTKHHKQSESKIVSKYKEDFWEDKVEGFIPPELPDYNDPTLSFLQTHLTPKSSILDLGGGAGRLSIPLAQKNYLITIVDSSKAMIHAAQQHSKYLNLKNVSTSHSEWQNFEDKKFDHIICSHVLYGISNIKEFILKIQSSINKSAIIIMYDKSPQSHLEEIWELYYSEPRINLPGMSDLKKVINQLNIRYQFFNIDENELTVYENFESLLNSVSSQIFVSHSEQNLIKLSNILNNYMNHNNDNLSFPLQSKRKLQAIILER
tara:strand:- start:817 stop:1632 length:816 start_codon:yes stop_codon:yes gene_type:complete